MHQCIALPYNLTSHISSYSNEEPLNPARICALPPGIPISMLTFLIQLCLLSVKMLARLVLWDYGGIGGVLLGDSQMDKVQST